MKFMIIQIVSLKLRVKIDDFDFVCFSPEKFVEIIENKILHISYEGQQLIQK